MSFPLNNNIKNLIIGIINACEITFDKYIFDN